MNGRTDGGQNGAEGGVEDAFMDHVIFRIQII